MSFPVCFLTTSSLLLSPPLPPSRVALRRVHVELLDTREVLLYPRHLLLELVALAVDLGEDVHLVGNVAGLHPSEALARGFGREALDGVGEGFGRLGGAAAGYVHFQRRLQARHARQDEQQREGNAVRGRAVAQQDDKHEDGDLGHRVAPHRVRHPREGEREAHGDEDKEGVGPSEHCSGVGKGGAAKRRTQRRGQQ